MTGSALEFRCPTCGQALGTLQRDHRVECPCGESFDFREGLWEFAQDFAPTGFPADRHAPLKAIEESHFWFTARDRLVIDRLEHHILGSLPRRPLRILDAGCAGGRFLERLQNRGHEVVGVDGYRDPLLAAARRLTTPHQTNSNPPVLALADVEHLPFDDQQFDAVVALDVLEHVQPGPFLRELRRVLRPDGGLLLTVPALPILWSRMDELAGHRCRYTVAQLKREFHEHGWNLGSTTHYQCFLLPLVLFSRFLARRSEQPLERHPPSIVNRLLGWVNGFEVRLFGKRHLPWGSSIIACGSPAS